MIFAREISDPLTSLVKKIDAATSKNRARQMGSFVVFLTDEEAAKDKLKELAQKELIKDTILTIDNVAGPPDYHIPKEADITVILYNKRKIAVNHAFKKGELNEEAITRILGELPKILPEDPEGPTSQLQEGHDRGLMVKRSAIMKTKPAADLGVARFWTVEKKNEIACLLVEVTGTVPMHFHPDGVHRMYILEGKLRCTLGEETMVMEAGDYMLIPRGVRHKLVRGRGRKSLFRHGGLSARRSAKHCLGRTSAALTRPK